MAHGSLAGRDPGWVAAFSPQAAWHAADDRWFMPGLGLASASDAGVWVSPETTFRCAAVLAAVRFLGNAVAVCPAQTFKWLPKDQRERDREHYMHRLMKRPHPRYTGFRWVRQQVTWASLWGYSYNRIRSGRTVFVEALEPLYPAYIRPVDAMADGSLIYDYQPPNGRPSERLVQNTDILHFSGVSLDGVNGVEIFQLIRNVVGIALAAQRHSATWLRKGTRLSGLLSTDRNVNDEKLGKIAASFTTRHGGSDNAGGVAAVADGFKFTPMAVDHQKAQFIELTNQQLVEMLMFIGVPGIVVGYAGDKANTYASVKAYFEEGGLKHSVLPWVRNLEEEMQATLFLDTDPHYVKFAMGALERASTREQFAMLVQGAGGPIISVDEARGLLEFNETGDPKDKRVRIAVGTPPDGGGEATDDDDSEEPPKRIQPAPGPAPANDDGDNEEEASAHAATNRIAHLAAGVAADRESLNALAERLARSIALSLVRLEIAAVVGRNDGARPRAAAAAVRHARDQAAFVAWADDFYTKHAIKVAERLGISAEASTAYASAQRDALVAGGVAAANEWELTATARLVALAMANAEAAA